MATVSFDYTIFLSDAALTASYQAAYPHGILISPAAAATLVSGGLNTGGPAPWVSTPGLTASSYLSTNLASVAIPVNQTIDTFGNLWPCAGAPAGTAQWRGNFLMEGGGVAPTADNLQSRRWTQGWELGRGEFAPTSFIASCITRDASRTPEGFGFAYRDEFNEGWTQITNGVTGMQTSWERFYIRPRKLGTVNDAYFWQCKNSVDAAACVVASYTTAGEIKFYALGTNVFPGVLLGTIPAASVPLNTWARLDLTIAQATAPGPGTGSIGVYLNGTRLFVGSASANAGLSTGAKHLSSFIGNRGFAAGGAQLDFDDWTNCSFPTNFNGLDWLNGNHIRLLRPSAFNVNSAASWTGDYRALQAVPHDNSFVDNVANTTASGLLAVDIDLGIVEKQLGIMSVDIGFLPSSATGTNAVGYSLNGGGNILTTITASSGSWSNAFYQSSLGLTPDPFTSFTLLYNKQDLGSQLVTSLIGCAEILGTFGSEDLPTTSVLFPPRIGIHNSPYPSDNYGQTFSPPAAPVSVMSGTYAGNSIGQDIVVNGPIHWFWVRPTSGAQGGHWFSSFIAGHNGNAGTLAPQRFIQAKKRSSDGAYLISITGANQQVNLTGTTYQWIAFSDPGMRYVINSAYRPTFFGTQIDSLVDPSFVPTAAWLVQELSTGSAGSLFFKGPGHTTSDASPIANTGVTASVAALGTGTITTSTGINNGTYDDVAVSAWRATDGAATGPVAIITYTGDGTGNRDIALDLGGRFPIFAFVQPHNDKGYFRDPSHTGVNSEDSTGGAIATAIKGGAINTLKVGATLNTNTVIYEVFALAGDATGAVSGGWTDNPTNPIFVAPTTQRPGLGPWAPTDTKGWWTSSAEFAGSVDLVTTPQNPKHPRIWSKIVSFATGTSGMLGGSPGAGVTYRNHLIYAGDDYTLGTTAPIIRIFDGESDRLMTSLSSVAGVVPKAIMSMILVGDTIYLSSLDSGSSAADYAGRVLAFDPLSQNLTPVGAQFTGGEVPYALVWHMGRLWCGTNKGNGAATKLYYFRPGVDTTWVQDFDMSTLSAGGVCSLASYNGNLYIGADAGAATFAQVLKRSSLGAYTSSKTATGGAATINNGFLSMRVFGTNLYAAYWNGDATAIAKVYKFDDSSWTTPYTGSSDTLRPYIGMFNTTDSLFVVGGGNGLAASLVSTLDGTTWTNLTAYLGGLATETALPIFGQVAV